MPRYVIGVDGGTSKTVALVGDTQGRILGAGRSGNSNWTGADVEKPMAVVAQAVSQALAQAGLPGDQIALGVFCLAGADWPEDYERRARALAQLNLARRVVVKNDALAGWRAGTRGHFGVVVTAGSGTNTAIITPDGREWCYGYYADYGGGGDMGQDAIRAVLRAEDGRGQPTSLTEPVLSILGYPNPDALLKGLIARQVERHQVYALCPPVFEAAAAGDPVAREIIIKQGLALAEYATAGIRRFGMQTLTFDVVLAGSVFKGRGSLLIDTITQAVQQVAPQARVVRSQAEPALGSLLLAYDTLELPLEDVVYDNLARSMPPPGFFSTR